MTTIPVNQAEIILWGTTIGYVHWDSRRALGFFSYDREFLHSGMALSPIHMPLNAEIYSFPTLSQQTFRGLPGLLADSLPDKFGNLLIDQWLQQQGRTLQSFSPVERLCYVGSRGMGGLEFKPGLDRDMNHPQVLDVDKLVNLANRALSQQAALTTHLNHNCNDIDLTQDSLQHIISVGTSAGGARAKAVIAWNESSNEVISGQLPCPEGFRHYLLKFDGIDANRDKELCDPKGFGRIEYAYYLMAKAAGITMADSRLLEENGRAHFMTERFDRVDGKKLHMQSLCAIAHYDFNLAGAYSYEQAMQTMKQMRLMDLHASLEELVRRMLFNIIARNQDDHTKNIAFLMNKLGEWRLAPAFDLTYSYNPSGEWTSSHQMRVNTKRDNFIIDDLIEAGKNANLAKVKTLQLLDEVITAVKQWRDFAETAGIEPRWAEHIGQTHRLSW